MPYRNSTYHSQLYRRYREIPEKAYQTLLRFFREHEEEIAGLELTERFELLFAYAEALFGVGAYEEHLQRVEEIIELAFHHNIEEYRGRDVLEHCLLRKAAAFFHLHQLERSEYVLRELLRINPHHPTAAYLLERCLRRQRARRLLGIKAYALAFFLLSGLFSLLMVLPALRHHPQWFLRLEQARNAFFLLGWGLLGGGWLHMRWRVRREVREFLQSARRRKTRERERQNA